MRRERGKRSRVPMKPTHTSDTKPRAIPTHCKALGVSPNSTKAPASTSTGRSALTEPVMVSGSFLITQ